MKAQNLFALLDNAAAQFGDLPAVVSGSETVASFAQLKERSLRLAGALSESAGRGDRVLVASKNCPEIVEIMFACWAAGLVVVPLNAKLHPREMAAIIEDATPRFAFVSKSLAIDLAEAAAGAQTRFVTIGSAGYRALLGHEQAEPVDVQPDDLAWLFYTSGTTGKSKGAMLSHGNLLAMTKVHWQDIDDPEARTALLHAAPMSHGSGLYILPYLARGAAQVVPASGQFDPAETCALCRTHRGVAMFLAPTMVQRLRDHVLASGDDPGDLRLIVYGGGPMYVSEMRRALDVFGPVFAQIYGQGETPMTITGLTIEDHIDASDAILGSVGRARANTQVRIADADGNALPAGELGEILVRGPSVMQGYWHMPEATVEALRDGWLWTGDMGVIDADGFLTLKDRSKDVIISGGSNIYPREVEEALLTHPAVAEVSVVGEPDADWGEVVVAHVALREGAEADSAALDAHCLDSIARFKRPKNYVFHDALPKSAYGKILKRELRSN